MSSADHQPTIRVDRVASPPSADEDIDDPTTPEESFQRVISRRNSRRLSTDPPPPPLVFLFPGMGCQWPGMAVGLKYIAPIHRSLTRSIDALKAAGIPTDDVDLDLVLYQTGDTGSPTARRELDRVTVAFVAVAAMQIALLDLLASCNIRPDFILGHSIGELMCAYADGHLTATETLLAAHARGRVLESKLRLYGPGAMAAVGLSYDDMRGRRLPGIAVACDNAAGMVTISGSESDVGRAVTKLTSDKVFAVPVDSAHVPFHHRNLQMIKGTMIKALTAVMPTEATTAAVSRRSDRWISTVGEESEKDHGEVSPAYLTYNLIHPVRFRTALSRLPTGRGGITVLEVGPHSLFARTVESELTAAIGDGSKVTHIPCMEMNETDRNGENILKAITQLRKLGYGDLDADQNQTMD